MFQVGSGLDWFESRVLNMSPAGGATGEVRRSDHHIPGFRR